MSINKISYCFTFWLVYNSVLIMELMHTQSFLSKHYCVNHESYKFRILWLHIFEMPLIPKHHDVENHSKQISRFSSIANPLKTIMKEFEATKIFSISTYRTTVILLGISALDPMAESFLSEHNLLAFAKIYSIDKQNLEHEIPLVKSWSPIKKKL